MNAILHIRKNVLVVTQAKLAEIAQTTQATVSRWESGEMSPDLSQMQRIRAEIIKREKPWDDAWFFSPAAQETAA